MVTYTKILKDSESRQVVLASARRMKGKGGEYTVKFKLPKENPRNSFISLRSELMAVVDEIEKEVKLASKSSPSKNEERVLADA